MTPASPQPRHGFEAFAYRDFTRYQMARVAAILGAEAQSIAVAWQVYSISHRAIDLGYTGLALFLPALLFLLPAGHVADRFDRRRVILICYSLQLLCTAALAVLAWRNTQNIMAIYAVLFFIGTGRAFSAPSSSSLIPLLVPEIHFVNAVTWGGVVFQFANITGPALGGLLFTFPLARVLPAAARLEGAGIVYLFTLATLVWFIVMVFSMHVRPGRVEHRATTLKVMLAGFEYVRQSQLLLGSFSLDLFVVLLGGATALMPIFAHDILHQGPRGLGMLRAAPALGSVAMALFMARFPMKRRAGHWLFICVSIFGIATIAFGLSRNLYLSLISLFIAGAADTISVIVRSSLLQLGTPPEVRGRASAVNSLFVGASNELGEFESGLTAQWWGAVRATVIGGIGSLVVAGAWAAMFPKLRGADELTSRALRARDPEEQEILTGF
jgi:MFS family permease